MRPRLALSVTAVAVVAVLAAVAGLVLAGDEGRAPLGPHGDGRRHGPSLARLDRGSATVTRRVPLAGDVNGLVAGGGALWVSGIRGGTHVLTKLDPDSLGVLDRVRLAPLVGSVPRGVAAGEPGVWAVAGDTVYRVRPRTGRVARARTPASGSQLTGVAVGDEGVWVVDATRQVVYRLDPRTGREIARFPVPGAADVAVGHGAAWVTSSGGGIYRIDATTNRVGRRIRAPGVQYGIAVGARGVWAVDTRGDAVLWVDPGSGEVETVRVGRGPTAVAASGRRVWVVNSRDGTLSAVDPGRRRVVATIEIGLRPYLVAATPSAAWVALLGRPDPHVEDDHAD